MSKNKLILRLFFTMLKIGLFTFGGGYAMIALLENEFVSEKKWIDNEEFMDMVAIAESTPGPIAINAATWIGYRVAGFFGSLVATLGMCIPSITVVFVISLFFEAFLSLRVVAAAFRGIQAAVIFLILGAGLKMLKKMKKRPFPLIVFSLTVVSMLTFSLLAIRVSAIYYILVGGAWGVGSYLLSLCGAKHNKCQNGAKKGGEL